MSFLKNLFGKDTSNKAACCDIKIVEVKEDTVAPAADNAQNTTTMAK